ncbi:centrosomal protein of 41 kDa-like [Babylonia areolata]|uniref:centrosomal protein of 41 kDa-like n=1 Tax=Babylonia areolata TaxID=304850 RepID=UPI003FD4BF45
MPKKGASAEHNWSFAFSPRKSRPRPKLFQEDRRTLQNILVDSMKDYKYKKNEMFKRMKVTTFVQMVLQIAEFEYREELPTLTETPFRPDTADLEVQHIQSDGAPDTYRSTTQQGDGRAVQRTGGRATDSSTDAGSTRALVRSGTCPYLLLDLRDRDSFQQSHIITAKSYPSSTLGRAVNYESKDMLKFRNQEGKIIIVYENEECEGAQRAATILVERGYENLFLLSGGLKEAYKIFPKGLITGTPPAVDGVKATPRPGPPQTAREATAAAAEDGSDFSQDDLDCLHMYLDNALMDTSSASRLTQKPKCLPGRTCTRLSSLSSSTNTTGTGRPPFRL